MDSFKKVAKEGLRMKQANSQIPVELFIFMKIASLHNSGRILQSSLDRFKCMILRK